MGNEKNECKYFNICKLYEVGAVDSECKPKCYEEVENLPILAAIKQVQDGSKKDKG